MFSSPLSERKKDQRTTFFVRKNLLKHEKTSFVFFVSRYGNRKQKLIKASKKNRQHSPLFFSYGKEIGRQIARLTFKRKLGQLNSGDPNFPFKLSFENPLGPRLRTATPATIPLLRISPSFQRHPARLPAWPDKAAPPCRLIPRSVAVASREIRQELPE